MGSSTVLKLLDDSTVEPNRSHVNDPYTLKLFKVLRGSMQLNHSELEYKYPTHLVPLANQYSRISTVEPPRTHVNEKH